ncbi:hypothetical protein Tco_1256126, partial [Tanacetum coccineum]
MECGSSIKLSLSSSRSSFIGMTRDSSDKHFFSLETWKVLWTFLSSSGSSSLYATRPIRERILKGPILQALSNLQYLFSGFMDYFWSRKLNISNFGSVNRSLKIVMENPNHLNEPNEAILEVNPVVPEPNQVTDIHDPNKMVNIPDDIDLVDYDDEDPEEDPKEDPEEEPKEDVDIEIEDDAELIFPYEVEGDKTPPPRDVSSDSVSSDSESEDEEVDVAPEATVGTITQKPYAIRDFLKGLYVVGESSSAHDSSYVGGLAPWALRRDLETSRARARLTEAEFSTYQTDIALL